MRDSPETSSGQAMWPLKENYKHMKKFSLVFLFLIWGFLGFAQQYDELTNHHRTADTTVYFVAINSNFGDSHQIEFQSGKLGVLFDDKFGFKDSVVVNVVKLSDQTVNSFGFKKKFGVNKFILENIDLNNLDSTALFSMSMQDDMGKKYQMNLTVNPVKNQIPIQAKIIKTPIIIDCQNPVNTKIEYFSDISGGKAPYLIEWDFSGSTEGLQEYIPIPGYSSAVLVDLPPPYFIGLKVTDSCGEITYQTVQVACDNSGPNYNSILFNIDPLRKRSIEK